MQGAVRGRPGRRKDHGGRVSEVFMIRIAGRPAGYGKAIKKCHEKRDIIKKQLTKHRRSVYNCKSAIDGKGGVRDVHLS